MLTCLVHLLTISQLAVSTEALPDPRSESCNVSRPDGGDTALLQTVKASGEPISAKEFAEKMQCHPQANSFFINGGDLVWVMNPNPGVLLGGPSGELGARRSSEQAVRWRRLHVHVEELPIHGVPDSRHRCGRDGFAYDALDPATLTLPIPTGCNDFWKKG